MCLENTTHQQTRWLRTMMHEDCFYMIESTEYATLQKGYAVKFKDQSEFDRWLTQQTDTGWEVSYDVDHGPDPVDHNTLHQLELNIFKTLRT